MIIKIQCLNLYVFAGPDPRVPRSDRTFQPPKVERPGKCQAPGCPGWMIRVREDGERKFVCDECGKPLDPGLDPGDIENQGHAFSGSAKP